MGGFIITPGPNQEEYCEPKGAETQAKPAGVERLQGSMGFWYLLAMAIASILGPWIVMSQFWYSLGGPSMSAAFLVTGLICVPIGLVYGELSAMFPKTGGSFMFCEYAFGKEGGYWVAWALLLSYLALMGYMCMAFVQILIYIVAPTSNMATDYGVNVIGGLVVVAIVFILLSRKIDLGARVQFWLFAYTVFIGIGFLVLMVLSPSFNPGANGLANFLPFGTDGFITGFSVVITMYFGFELIPQFAEECSYPHKKHWIVMTASIAFAALFYAAICFVETSMLPFDTIMDTTIFPNFVGYIESQMFYGNWLAYLLGIANIATLVSCIIGFWLGGSRMLYSMGRDNIFPKAVKRLNKNSQPWVANILILAISVFFILQAGTSWLANLFLMMSIGVAIAYTLTCVGFIVLRYRMPDHPRPWKVPGGVITGAIAVVAGVVITYYVFIYFTTDMWILFIAYFIFGGVIRAVLWAEHRRARVKEGATAEEAEAKAT